ncbi:MAG: hypothetical protein PHS14_03895 [Elusimicrobia bacterium]|nr:hypothetical protein [Elusimicrobiota bacterium]
MGHFNRSFIRLRTNNGFKTAYNFYHSNGGRRVFPFTYAHYLKIERGGSLPNPSALAIMLELLRRKISARERTELMRDYLRDLSGDDAVYDKLFAPLISTSGASAQESALPLILGRIARNLTPAQFRAIVSSPEATGCFMLLANVPDPLSVDKIAEYIGSSKAACLAAMKILRSGRVVAAHGLDRYACAIPSEQRCQLPNPLGLQPLYDTMRENIDRIAGKQGRPLYERSCSIRLRPATLDQLTHGFEETFNTGSSLSQKMMKPEPETPLYFIEARVRRLIAFPPDDTPLPKPHA